MYVIVRKEERIYRVFDEEKIVFSGTDLRRLGRVVGSEPDVDFDLELSDFEKEVFYRGIEDPYEHIPISARSFQLWVDQKRLDDLDARLENARRIAGDIVSRL